MHPTQSDNFVHLIILYQLLVHTKDHIIFPVAI